MSDERSPISDERLDELLDAARWPDVDQAVVRRLVTSLRDARDPSMWRTRALPLALAASVAIMFILGTLHLLSRRSNRPIESVAHVAPARATPMVPSRPPTISEQTIAMSMSIRRRPTPVAKRSEASPAVAIDIVAKFNKPLVRDRFAAARTVGSTCDERVVRELIAICEDRNAPRAVYRREALAALLSCHDPNAARYLKSLDAEPFRRAELQAVKSEVERNL